MKLPKYVVIHGVKIKVNNVKEPFIYDNSYVLGLASYHEKSITVVNNQDALHTLLHEMGHILFSRLALNQTSISLDLQEVIVDSFATMMIEQFKISLK